MNRPSRPISRRAMLRGTACGFGALGLRALLAEDGGLLAGSAAENPLAPRLPHFSPRAKRVIFVFMHGGPSQVDTFDPKPRLDKDHGKPIPFKLSLQFAPKDLGGLMKSPFAFRRYGQSGIPVSDLFRQVGAHADELCVIRSMVGEGVDHGAALLQLNTGTLNFTLPSMGSWIFYGLGTENQNLPGYIEIKPSYLPRRRQELAFRLSARRLSGDSHRQRHRQGGGHPGQPHPAPDQREPNLRAAALRAGDAAEDQPAQCP